MVLGELALYHKVAAKRVSTCACLNDDKRLSTGPSSSNTTPLCTESILWFRLFSHRVKSAHPQGNIGPIVLIEGTSRASLTSLAIHGSCEISRNARSHLQGCKVCGSHHF
ncbi:unnamed protein product, partial [Scytosiphon promiscuus]